VRSVAIMKTPERCVRVCPLNGRAAGELVLEQLAGRHPKAA
jgi:hypothetical protein